MKARLLPLIVAALVALPACGNLLDPAAAVVDGEKITFEEVREGTAGFEASPRFQELAQEQDADRIRRQSEQGYLSMIVKRRVLEPRAEELGVEVTDQQVDERLEAVKQELGSEEDYQRELEQQGYTEEDVRVILHVQLLEETLRDQVAADVAPTEAELQEAFEENQEQAVQTRAQHILVEGRGLAQRLANRLHQAGDNQVEQLFERLARQHSTDPGSAQDGGDLGFSRPGSFVPEFEQAMEELDEGEVSDPVQTDFGWHVIRVVERRELTLDDVRDEITGELLGPLQEEAWGEWLEEAYEEADVRVNPRYGELDPHTGNIVDATADDIPGGEAPGISPEEPPPGFEDLEDGHDH